ncbi:MAG: type VII toxin-antitoxin system HepT family RNase toxin [Sulfuriferula sp.]
MRLDLYHAECIRIANEQTALLDEVKQRIQSGAQISRLEQNGVLHSFQILIENAIGKAKHLLKLSDLTVPVSAYDTFAGLEQQGKISSEALQQWNSSIGLRNRIVHDYMNIDMQLIYELIINDRHQFIAMFLRLPIE